MAVDYLDIFLSFIHLTGAFIWIGAVLYMEIIFKPVLNKLEPPVRSTVMRNLIPRQSKILMAALMVTGISGIVRAILLVPTPSIHIISLGLGNTRRRCSISFNGTNWFLSNYACRKKDVGNIRCRTTT